MYVEERWTEIGTGTQKGYYEDFHNRVSKEDEMLFKLKDNKSAYSNGYTLVVEKLIVNEHWNTNPNTVKPVLPTT